MKIYELFVSVLVDEGQELVLGHVAVEGGHGHVVLHLDEGWHATDLADAGEFG